VTPRRQSIVLALCVMLAATATGLWLWPTPQTHPPDHACRLWGMIGTTPHEPTILDQLVTGTHSLRTLATANADGWGLAYHSPRLRTLGLTRPELLRAGPPANDAYDTRFAEAVSEMLTIDATCAIIHLRAATAGHSDIPDPHPFCRGDFAFAHNGTVSVDKVTTLLTQDDLAYLDTHRVDYTNPSLDSELYWLYVLKLRDQGVLRRDGKRTFSTAEAIAEAALQLHLNSGIVSAANCVLSSADTLYALRFDSNDQPRYKLRFKQISDAWVVASEPVGTDTTGWGTVPAKSLAILRIGAAPVFRTVYPPPDPYMIVNTQVVNDSLGGNNDQQLDAGETIHLFIDLKNIGSQTAQGVHAVLHTSNSHVTLKDSTCTYGDFASGEVKPGIAGDHFVWQIAGDCPDQDSLGLRLEILDGSGEDWTAWSGYTIDSPVLAMVYRMLDDDAGGDGDGILEPGESALVRITLANSGHSPASGLAATLTSLSDTLTVTQPTAGADTIAAGASVVLAPDFEVSLDSQAMMPSVIQCRLDVIGDWNLVHVTNVIIPVGGFRDDMESGVNGWTHAIVTPGFRDQWHWTSYRNNTPGGAHSWKFGGANNASYADSADGALITPPIQVLQFATLNFWHWIDAETVIGGQGDAYDGGIVEMSVNGGAWAQITPEGGYPNRIRGSIRPGPFPVGTQVFSGTHTWEPESFMVETDGGELRFRFRFGSNGTIHREGWYIDDVEVLSWANGSGDAGGDARPERIWLRAAGPNPASRETRLRFALPTPQPVTLRILDAQGRVVRTLIEGRVDAGEHEIAWDGRDAHGMLLGSGVYFSRFDAGGRSETRKLAIVR
jgi:predicted glutamine amidotransferase